MDRRTALHLVGAGIAGALAGCVGDGNDGPGDGADDTDDGRDDDTATPADGVDVRTTPFTLRNSRPRWRTGEDAPGWVTVVDSETRQRAVFGAFEVDHGRDDLREFVADVDYATERLVVVESAGPNLCYTDVAVEDVRLEDGRLRGRATALDTSDDEEACASTVAYPSVLLRVTFGGAPADEAAIEVTDGWEETATVTAGAADPLGPAPADLPGAVAPDGEATPVAPLACDDEDFDRHDQWFDEADTQRGDFAVDGEPALSMRVADPEYARGDTVEIRLTNVADELVDTGNRHKYNLQVYTEAGWQDVRGAPGGPFGYTDEAVVHPPGDGFTWRFEFTEAGIVEDAVHDFEVCPALQAGRYRFAYFGVIGDGAVTAAFDLTG